MTDSKEEPERTKVFKRNTDLEALLSSTNELLTCSENRTLIEKALSGFNVSAS